MNTMATPIEGRKQGHEYFFLTEIDGVQKTRCYCCDRKKQVCRCTDAIPHCCKILPKLPSEELTHYRDFEVDLSPPTKINVKTVQNNTFWTVDNNGCIVTQKSKLQKSSDYIFWLQKCIAKCNNELRLCYIIKWKDLYLNSYLHKKSLCLHFVEESERTDEIHFIWEEQRKNKYIISTLQSAVFKGYYITFDESKSSFSLQYKRRKKETSFVVHITGINIVDSFDCGGSDSDLSTDSDDSDVENPCPTNTQDLDDDNSHDSSSSDIVNSNTKSNDVSSECESLQLFGTETKQKGERDQQVVKSNPDSDENRRPNNSDDSILKNSSNNISYVPACFNFFCCCKRYDS